MASGSAMSAPSTFTLRLFSSSGKRWSRRTTCGPAVVIEPLAAVSVRPPFSCCFRHCPGGVASPLASIRRRAVETARSGTLYEGSSSAWAWWHAIRRRRTSTSELPPAGCQVAGWVCRCSVERRTRCSCLDPVSRETRSRTERGGRLSIEAEERQSGPARHPSL